MRRFVVFVCLIAASFLSASAANLVWDVISPYPTPGSLNSVAFGNGRFVAVGGGLPIWSEDSGAHWTAADPADVAGLRTIIFTNETFIAAGGGGKIATSADGKRWSNQEFPAAGTFLTLTYGGGAYVATADSGAIAVSMNATNWTLLTNLSSGRLGNAAYGNGKFVVWETSLSNGAFVLTSTNGTNWFRSSASIPQVDPDCVPNPRIPPFVCEKFVSVGGLAFADGSFRRPRCRSSPYRQNNPFLRRDHLDQQRPTPLLRKSASSLA